MNVVVTGAAGFIGSHTVDRLLAEGHAVIGLDNLRSGRLDNLKKAFQSPHFHFEQIDITESGKLNHVFQRAKARAVIHLAALVSVQESIANLALNHLLNVEATNHVAEAAADHVVPRVVFASSAAVYGNCSDLPLKESSDKRPLSPYGSAKLQSEHLLFDCARKHHLTALCLRYFNVYGLRQDEASPYSGVITIFRNQFLAGQPFTIYGDGEQTRDFIHVSDVAKANVLAATRPDLATSATNICTGRSTSLNELVTIFGEHHPVNSLAKYAPERSGDIRNSCGDPSLARTKLGFSADILIRDGMSEFIAEEVEAHRPHMNSGNGNNRSQKHHPQRELIV